ncbi:MAG: TetR/AcrR family transcriptional regulator [Muribaculaceae bacterium]|nr:TetR/AcrR family transcriptional regulator [Muribaculaceae bacterium]
MRTGGDATRKRLLTAALRLFTQKPYDKVTLKEIESATGLSRGALMYHVPNKETLFREAVEMFVFGNNTLTALEDSDKESLKTTICSFVKMLSDEQDYWRKEGVENINYSLVNIQMSYYSIFKESLKAAGEWYENECSLWREVIERAIASGEIRRVDSGLYAHVFENCYLGTAYAGLPLPGGYSPEMVGEQLLAIYSFLSLNVED